MITCTTDLIKKSDELNCQRIKELENERYKMNYSILSSYIKPNEHLFSTELKGHIFRMNETNKLNKCHFFEPNCDCYVKK